MMISGSIKALDVTRRRAVIAGRDGQEIVVTFPEGAIIEVAEPETMGTMGGELSDLQEGFWVEVEVAEQDAEGNCRCTSLVCVS
ncbi:MAG: hypothetical protein D6736_12640 [Nitrospinota bacterium]|nr:MAG: hypothetical protein D6736_12640 [Nitrospinota bacterium]